MNLDDCNKCGGGPCHGEHDTLLPKLRRIWKADREAMNPAKWEEFDKKHSPIDYYEDGVLAKKLYSLTNFDLEELLSAQQASLRERLESERREKPKDGWFKYCGCDGECFAACDRSFNTGIDAAIALLDGG